jgi:lysophospholipase
MAQKTNSAFGATGEMPTVALTTSGGGFRSFLIGAGIIQALDGRETSHVSTSGLYQRLTYHSALSGGSWLLSSIAANDFSTISSLMSSTWETVLANGLFGPEGAEVSEVFAIITTDLAAKEAAGFRGTLTDAWSRLLSYMLLPGADGGVSNTLSQVAHLPNSLTYNAPYPIMTAGHVDLSLGLCLPPLALPYGNSHLRIRVLGSQIASFTPTMYLGSSLASGKPTVSGSCIAKYDNLGFVLGTSSSLFNDEGIDHVLTTQLTLAIFCTVPCSSGSSTDPVAALLLENVNNLPYSITSIELQSPADLFAAPNPFYSLSTAPAVSAQQTLSMVDGGESGQANPIFPFLLPARNVSVILVNDNDGDTAANYPKGQEL